MVKSGAISFRTYMLANHAEPDVLPSTASRKGERVPGATTQCLLLNLCQPAAPFTDSVSQAVNKSIRGSDDQLFLFGQIRRF